MSKPKNGQVVFCYFIGLLHFTLRTIGNISTGTCIYELKVGKCMKAEEDKQLLRLAVSSKHATFVSIHRISKKQ